MPTTQELLAAGEEALIKARVALQAQFRATADPLKQQEIEDASNAIAALLLEMAAADLLTAAGAVGAAAARLEDVVRDVTHQPLSGAMKGVVDALNRLNDVRGEMHNVDALPPAAPPPRPLPAPSPSPPTPAPPGPPAAPPAPPAAPPVIGAVPQTSTARDFSSLRDEYETFFAGCTVRPERQGNIDYYLKNINAGRSRYEEVVVNMAVPWYFVGLLHAMEAGFNFNRHLHNGDPLTARTVRVPAGHPVAGTPPFAWLVSARDAVRLKRLDTITDWGVPRMLYLLESFNGFGYRQFMLPSPYLWSFSNLYDRGKYVADRQYDPGAVSQQCGAAVILKAGKASGLFD